MAESSIPKVLIPAAGFGKRLGANISKEMLTTFSDGPMIDWCLDLALSKYYEPVVISRKAKHDLNEYITKKPLVKLLEIESSQEWPDTLLQSQAHWSQKNLVLLPDTRFAPVDCVDNLLTSLDYVDVSFGTFEVSDFSTWGICRKAPKGFQICEKPFAGLETKDALAWGIFAFRKVAGVELLNGMLDSTRDHAWKSFSLSSEFHALQEFSDLARVSLRHSSRRSIV